MASDEVAFITELKRRLRGDRDNQIRMHSKTFWLDGLGIQRKHPGTVNRIEDLLKQNQITVISPEARVFGSEASTAWLTFTLDGWRPWPTDDWFGRVAKSSFESEPEVVKWFVHELLEALGYVEDDLAEQYAVYAGFSKSQRIGFADVAVFDGDARNRALFVIEVKKPSKRNLAVQFTSQMEAQAESYAYWLRAPAWVLTNAVETRVYIGRWGDLPERELTFCRANMRECWPQIVRALGREAMVERSLAMLKV